jgi:hypothetical protein
MPTSNTSQKVNENTDPHQKGESSAGLHKSMSPEGYGLDKEVFDGFLEVLTRYKTVNQGLDMRIDRANDIRKIQAHLENKKMTHERLHNEVSSIVNKMWTGLVFFNVEIIPWRSRLKNELEILLEHSYPIEDMQKRDKRRNEIELTMADSMESNEDNNTVDDRDSRIQELTEENEMLLSFKLEQEIMIGNHEETIRLLKERQTRTEDYSELKKECDVYKEKIASLEVDTERFKSTIEKLRSETRLLRRKNTVLQEENRRLKIEIEELKRGKNSSNDHQWKSHYDAGHSSFFSSESI